MVPSLLGTKFMSNPGKGGRGKNAPYLTVHYRIPEPIKPTVERLASAFRILAGTRNVEGWNNLLDRVNSAIAASEENQNQLSVYDAIIEKLESDLKNAQEEIEQLKSERERAINILVPALKISASTGGKIKQAIRSAFPELADK